MVSLRGEGRLPCPRWRRLVGGKYPAKLDAFPPNVPPVNYNIHIRWTG